MPVVLVHSLFPRFEMAYKLMCEHQQLYLDMTNVLSSIRWYREWPDNWLEQAEGTEIERNLDYFALPDHWWLAKYACFAATRSSTMMPPPKIVVGVALPRFQVTNLSSL